MENKKYDWTENKFSNVMSTIGLIIFVSGLLITLILLFFNILGDTTMITFLSFMFSSGIWLLMAKGSSTKDEYSNLFISSVERRLSEVKSKEDLIDLYDFMASQAFDDDGYRLSYPIEFGKLFNKVNAQIEILDKLEVK
jgi:hypothetical protein